MFELNERRAADKHKEYQIDDVLSQFHVYGRYHLRVLLLLILAYTLHAMASANYIFAVEKTSYRCYSSNLCDINPHNYSSGGEDNACFARVSTCASDIETEEIPCNCTDPCNEWIYDNPNSFVAEFGLGCEEWKWTLVGTVHNIGLLTGLLLVGPFSDRYGRKLAFVLTGITGGLLGLAKSFVTSYWLYIALEFFGTAIGLEVISAKDRILFLTLAHLGLQTGTILFGFMAWCIPYWRNLLIVIYASTLLLIFYIFAIDESPRWLLTKGRKEEAVIILKKAAKLNKLTLDETMLDNLTCNQEQGDQKSYLSALKITFCSRILLRRFLVALVWWITSILVHYGGLINSVFIPGSKHLNFTLMGVVDVPAILIMGYLLSNFRRKNPLMFSFLGTAVFLLIQPFLPSDVPWLSLLFYLVGRFFMTICFGTTYIFTSELFPTLLRHTMHAMCSSVGRIGSIIAPQTPLLMAYWTGLPTLIFGGMSLLAGLLTLTVPDSANDALPDTVQEAEKVGSRN